MVRFVSVVFGLPGSCIWRGLIWWHLTFSGLSHIRCHTRAYFHPDEVYRSWGSCVRILIREMYVEMMMYSLSSRWFLSGAYREPSSQARAFRCLDVVMLPSEGRLLDMWVWFSCRRRWFELIYFFRHVTFSTPHWGIFPLSDEIYKPPLIFMIILGYKTRVGLRVRSHFIMTLRMTSPWFVSSGSHFPMSMWFPDGVVSGS